MNEFWIPPWLKRTLANNGTQFSYSQSSSPQPFTLFSLRCQRTIGDWDLECLVELVSVRGKLYLCHRWLYRRRRSLVRIGADRSSCRCMQGREGRGGVKVYHRWVSVLWLGGLSAVQTGVKVEGRGSSVSLVLPFNKDEKAIAFSGLKENLLVNLHPFPSKEKGREGKRERERELRTQNVLL